MNIVRGCDIRLGCIYEVQLVYNYGEYVEDRYMTRTILKLSRQFYKWLAGFKMGWPDLIHYVHPGPL